MRHEAKNDSERLHEGLATRSAVDPAEGHVVFDFTGLEQASVADLSLILTARLKSAPTDVIWVRSLPPRMAHVLRILRLDHLFRPYPEGADLLN